MFTYELKAAISACKQMTVGKGSRTDLLMSCLRTPLRAAGHLLELEETRMKEREEEGAGKSANKHLLEGGICDIRSCKNRPGRLVMKIQSVTLNRGLSLADESLRRTSAPLAKVYAGRATRHGCAESSRPLGVSLNMKP